MVEGPIYRLLLDARAAFPYADPGAKQKTHEWSKTPPVAAALALLPESEQARVLKYYFPRDAALSLAAFLLKHHIVVRTCGVPWSQSNILASKDVQNGKPYYANGGVEFNVSHHGEAVVLVATTKKGVKAGIDLTKIDMVKDIQAVNKSGFQDWVNIFADVFSGREVQNIVRSVPPTGSLDTSSVVTGLRTFYSYWALKEAYFKMTGDALLASWLQHLEFSNVQPPQSVQGSSNKGWDVGQVTKATASLRGKTMDDTQLELAALGEHYIVATSITSHDPLPLFEIVDVAAMILPTSQ